MLVRWLRRRPHRSLFATLPNQVLPLTVFNIKGVPDTRRELIQTAVEAGGKHLPENYEAWISAHPWRGLRVLITGPEGFERRVVFAADEEPSVITERVRAALEDA